MERNVEINEISDGHKYHVNDMVKIGCNDCSGCSSCCENMQGLITLDPYDIFRLASSEDHLSFETMLNKNIELVVDRGLLLPVLKMSENAGKCCFLREDGRCSIHNIRPGICRLFPMGRLYEDGSFYYFLQKDECNYPEKTKVKLKKWLDTPNIGKYEQFVSDWHYFLMEIREYIKEASEEETGQINTVLLKIFFMTAYTDDFYSDFYGRLQKVQNLMR